MIEAHRAIFDPANHRFDEDTRILIYKGSRYEDEYSTIQPYVVNHDYDVTVTFNENEYW